MKVTVVGSEGYLGRPLCERLEKDLISVQRIDALVYGQRQPSGMRYAAEPTDYHRLLEEFQPDVVVWLAAYAHDPRGEITVEEMVRNNASHPVSTFFHHRKSRWIFLSSLSTMSPFGAYPEAKRALESMLLNRPSGSDATLFCTHADILRFGTIYGVDNSLQDVESFRGHLLLNSMVIGAVLDNKIRISQPDTFRPVLGIDRALDRLCDLIAGGDSPHGSITNHFDTCATLHTFAIWVQQVARDYGFTPVLDYGFVRVDPRDYGWGLPSSRTITPRLHTLFRWVIDNKEHLRLQRDTFPENLYGYVKQLRATKAPPVGD